MKNFTLCPCCGKQVDSLVISCSCGARSVGNPQIDPIVTIPSLKFSILGLAFTLVSLLCYFSKFWVAASILGLYFCLKGLKAIKRAPQLYGGKYLALTGTILSSFMILFVLTNIGFGIPKWLRLQKDKQSAATRARMIEMSIAFEQYRQKKGGLPSQLIDLQREGIAIQSPIDTWQGAIMYNPTGQLASINVGKSQSSAPIFTNYTLVSAGPDSQINTFDDIILNDCVFVTPRPLLTMPTSN